MKRAVEPVARAIPGEHPSRAVRAVGGRRESYENEPRARIAEAGNWFSPIGLGCECPALLASDLEAVTAEARAGFAPCYLALEPFERRGCRHGATIYNGRPMLIPRNELQFDFGGAKFDLKAE